MSKKKHTHTEEPNKVKQDMKEITEEERKAEEVKKTQKEDLQEKPEGKEPQEKEESNKTRKKKVKLPNFMQFSLHRVFGAGHGIGVFIFLLIPLVQVVVKSFAPPGQGLLYYYKLVLGNEAFTLAAENMFRFELASVPLLMIISLFCSVVVYKWGNTLVKYAFLLPLTIPSNALAVIWKLVFEEQGLCNGILVNVFHVAPVDFMGKQGVFILMTATFIWKNIGYNMLVWLAGLSAIPGNIYDAGRVDGAGEWRLFWYLTLPNLRGTIFIAAVLSLVNSFKIYREAYLIAGNYPQESIYLLQHVFNNWFAKLDVHKLAAGAVLTAIAFFTLLSLIAAHHQLV